MPRPIVPAARKRSTQVLTSGTPSGSVAVDAVGAQDRALDGDRRVRVDEAMDPAGDARRQRAAFGDGAGIDRKRMHGAQSIIRLRARHARLCSNPRW